MHDRGRLAEEVAEERKRRCAVELDALLFVCLDALFDRLARIVQTAFDRVFRYAERFRDLARFQFVIIIQHHAHALFIGELVHEIDDHAARFLIVERFVRDLLFVRILEACERVFAVLGFGEQKLFVDLAQAVLAMVCRDPLDPADIGVRIDQIPDLAIHRDQDVLRGILRRLFALQHSEAVIIDHVLHVGQDAVHRLRVVLLCCLHVLCDFGIRPFCFHMLPLSFHPDRIKFLRPSQPFSVCRAHGLCFDADPVSDAVFPLRTIGQANRAFGFMRGKVFKKISAKSKRTAAGRSFFAAIDRI